MAYAKIEPTGCCVHKGLIQVRINLYLEFGDPRYDEHHIWDEVNEKWQNNPFLNHFIFVSPNTSNAEIKRLMDECLAEFLPVWSRGQSLTQYWHNKRDKPKVLGGDLITDENTPTCENRVAEIKLKAEEIGRD